MLCQIRHGVFAAAVMALSATFCLAEDRTITIDEGSFAAIAYSPSTDTYAYAHSKRTRQSAEDAALKACVAPDARIASWANNGFCALAFGDDAGCWGGGHDHGGGSTNLNAMDRAVEQCEKFTKNCRAVLCLSSDGQYVDDAYAKAPAVP